MGVFTIVSFVNLIARTPMLIFRPFPGNLIPISKGRFFTLSHIIA